MREIVLCTTLTDHSLDLMKELKGSPLLDDARIHIVHCFEIQVYTNEFSPYIYPTEDKYPELTEAAQSILQSVEDELKKEHPSSEYIKEVYFTQSPKQKMKEYLSEINADLVVVATRGKHGIEGLFTSSFAEFLVKYSPCDIHILRPKN
ncbi:MAG: hypothetical protein CME63_05860 [Halobacteriovoraceae bacterium]|nr:hypothetical protein [Halobacteriovoraceae bacterium]MBC97254.1 hypothetical protein [Halobacteriovoraceae bacterium]|tara:strand:- start:25373 stop:25819 length:447 start_codon:yes stop_codon:yes gene_type:complete